MTATTWLLLLFAAEAAPSPSPFPTLFYGANATGPQNATQLKLDARHAIVVYGAEHQTAALGWRGVGAALSAQCAALKRAAVGMASSPRCFVYRQGAFSMPWFDADRAAMLNPQPSPPLFLPGSDGVPLAVPSSIVDPLWPPANASSSSSSSFSSSAGAAAPIGQSLLWDHRQEAVVQRFVDEAEVLAADPAVDGVLYDDVDFVACRAPAFAPCAAPPSAGTASGGPGAQPGPCGVPFPGGDRAAFFNATWGLFRRVAAALGAVNKTALLASANWMSNVSWPTVDSRNSSYRPLAPAAPAAAGSGAGGGGGAVGGLRDPGACPLPQEAALEIMAGVPWAHFYGGWHNARPASPALGAPSSLSFNRSRCVWLTEEALAEAARGVDAITHTAAVLGAKGGGSGDSSSAQRLAAGSLDLAAASFLLAYRPPPPPCDGGRTGGGGALGFSVGPAAAGGGGGAGRSQWSDRENTHGAGESAAVSPFGRELGAPLGPAQRLGCCDGALLPHTYVHDAVGFGDLFNVILPNASACAALCCSMDECAGFQWTSLQGAVGPISNTSKCIAGGPCCWIKPSIGRIEHITYNATEGSMQFPMVSGIKAGTTWRREFEHVQVQLDCAMPSASLSWR